MFKTVKDLIDRLSADFAQPADAASGEHPLQLATAVLLVEVTRAAPEVQESEYDAVLHALRRKFALSEDELQQLLALAHERSRTAYDYQHFTQQLNERFTHAQKVAMVEAMWEVAYADEHLDVHENAVIRKVAGLLHVTHGEYIAAKLHAKEAGPPSGHGQLP
jgi:uncharacterized tellurite resistance protein B-like protein